MPAINLSSQVKYSLEFLSKQEEFFCLRILLSSILLYPQNVFQKFKKEMEN